MSIRAKDVAPWMRVSTFASASALLFDVAAIALAIAVSEAASSMAVYVFAVAVIGARQHGLGILVHEASHRGLFRNSLSNDLVGEVVLAWPLGISMFAYRTTHGPHHRHTNTDRDPDWNYYRDPDAPHYDRWTFPKAPARLFLSLARDLCGLGVLDLLGSRDRYAYIDPAVVPAPLCQLRRLRLPFYAAAVAVVVVTQSGWLVVQYWLVPMATYLSFVLRWRLIAEHSAVGGGAGTRTTLTSPLGRFFVGPHHVNFHAEHHMFPGVRFHALPKLHRLVHEAGALPPDARVTRGYLRVLAECIAPAAQSAGPATRSSSAET